MPLGLSVGPDLHAPLKTAPASLVADTSPLGLATSPRQNYAYGRICGAFEPVACPGNAVNTTVIPADIVNKFNATPYGPFGMQVCFFFPISALFRFLLVSTAVPTLLQWHGRLARVSSDMQ
jgi:hypothetical protein